MGGNVGIGRDLKRKPIELKRITFQLNRLIHLKAIYTYNKGIALNVWLMFYFLAINNFYKLNIFSLKIFD